MKPSTRPFTPVALDQIDPARDLRAKSTPSRWTLAPPSWVGLFAFLALVQTMGAGYRFGVGNQAIQIAFLKKLIDPRLYPGDPLTDAIASYPSFLFRALAPVAGAVGVAPLYFVLHCLACFGVLAGCFLLCRAMFRSSAAGVVAVALLLAGHHEGLASTNLYWPGFTHTWAAWAIGILVLVLFYKDRLRLAFLLNGLLFNVHALTAAYLLAILGLWCLVELAGAAKADRLQALKQAALRLGLFALAAAPTLIVMAGSRERYDAAWIRLVRIRSSQHSFPLSWWEAGNPEIPRFLLVLGFGILATSFRMPRAAWCKTCTLAVAIGALLAVGFVGAEFWPVPLIVRAQLFRSSAFLTLIALLMAAHGIVAAWTSQRDVGAPDASGLVFPRWMARLEACNAVVVFLVLAVPALGPLLPAAFLLSVLVALARGRLSRAQALACGAILLTCAAAHRSIQFPLIGWPSWQALTAFLGRAAGTGAGEFWLALLGSAILALRWFKSRTGVPPVSRGPRPSADESDETLFLETLIPLYRALVPPLLACVLAVLLGVSIYRRVGAMERHDDPWIDAQAWARENTPRDAIFLTPPAGVGFRMVSERPIVGEWRDGTHQYFSAAFATGWWDRMQQLLPGRLYDSTGRTELAPGSEWATLSDDQIAALCAQYAAKFVVLPKGEERSFIQLYENARWTICSSQRKPPPPPPVAPAGARGEEVWAAQKRFLDETVGPNIEKNRKSDVALRFVDTNGRPLQGVPYEIHQTDSLFRFGSALERFVLPPGPLQGDAARAVSPKVLEYFPQIFNFSVIGYSGKWEFMEPQPGHVFWDDLDAYIDWCEAHHVEVQYHFVTGYEPNWVKALPEEERKAALLRHARQLLERYGKRIPTWQIVNESHLLRESPGVYQLFREWDPHLKVGLSDCARFWTPQTLSGIFSPQAALAAREKEMLMGMEGIEWLRTQGAEVDFMAYHGHMPRNLWADLRDVYEALDKTAQHNLRIYVSEFCVRQGDIAGPVRTGTWTDDLQADYYETLYATVFSHPAVDGLNIWGMGNDAWMPGSGLLDAQGNPKPVFWRLKKLITETWRTNLTGDLGLDGAVTFRGFHGTYDITLRPVPGPERTAHIVVRPGDQSGNQISLVFDEAKGALEPRPEP